MEETYPLNKNFLTQKILFGIMAFLTMSTTFTTVLVGGGAAQLQIPSLSAFMPSIQDAMGLNCAQVDASPNGECKQTIVQSSSGFTDCNDDNIDNCVADQDVDVNNVLNSNEDPRIAQSITQLLDCDNNIACENSVLNDAFQEVFVDSAGNSIVDFDVAQTMTQTMAEGGQSNFDAENIGSQDFEIDAFGNARVDADSSDAVDIQTRLTQLTDECDGSPTSTCSNIGRTDYFVTAGSNAFVDLSTPQGLEMTQQNVDCDNGVDCTNDAYQDVVIGANEFTTGSAFVDFETGSSFSDLVQRNECEITDGGDPFSCLNTHDNVDFLVDISAEDNSRVDVDNFGQDTTQVNDCTNAGAGGCTNDMFSTDFFDINTAGNAIVNVDGGTDTSQTNDCSDGAECENIITDLNYDIDAIDNSRVDVDGTQDVTQTNDCDNGADCSSTALLEAGFDASGASRINADFEQEVNQLNDCTNGANCVTDATMQYFVTSRDGAIITSDSDQSITQTNTCSNGQNCVLTGTVTNNVFASGNARLNADSSQTLNQACTTSSGSNCLRTNTVSTSGSATNNAILNYVTSQNIQPSDGSGTASISIARSSGTSNVGPVSQTSNGNIVR